MSANEHIRSRVERQAACVSCRRGPIRGGGLNGNERVRKTCCETSTCAHARAAGAIGAACALSTPLSPFLSPSLSTPVPLSLFHAYKAAFGVFQCGLTLVVLGERGKRA
jgi:hypothetical protein